MADGGAAGDVCVVDGLANAGDVAAVDELADAGEDDGGDCSSYEHVTHTKQMCREILSLVSNKKLTQTGSVAALKVFRKHAPEDAVGSDDDQLDIPTTYEQVIQLPITVHPHPCSTHIHTYTHIHTHTHTYI